MLRPVALVGTHVSEESVASIIKVTRFGKLEIKLAITSNRSTLRRNNNSSETSVFTRATGLTSQKTAFIIVTAVKPQILNSINQLNSVAET
jgi:hypothetical protein